MTYLSVFLIEDVLTYFYLENQQNTSFDQRVLKLLHTTVSSVYVYNIQWLSGTGTELKGLDGISPSSSCLSASLVSY